MPYCFECGSLLQLHDPVCPSCGRNLNQGPVSGGGLASQDPVLGESVTHEMADKGNNNPAGNGEWCTSRFLAQESQLGKGTIKPKVVETGLDGIHFKYDEPPRNFVKTEPSKEKVVEFRVTNPEFNNDLVQEETTEEVEEVPPEVSEPEAEIPVTDREEVQPVEEGDPVAVKDASVPEVEEKVVSVPVVEVKEDVSVPEIEAKDASVPGEEQDVLMPEMEEEWVDGARKEFLETEELPEDEPFPEPVAPEPEMRMTPENRRILWEGRQTWYGIPMTKMYRITNYTLMVTDEQDHRLFEADLALITAVRIKQNWLSKLLGIGDLLVWVRDFPDPRFKLEGILEPLKVKTMLEDFSGSAI